MQVCTTPGFKRLKNAWALYSLYLSLADWPDLLQVVEGARVGGPQGHNHAERDQTLHWNKKKLTEVPILNFTHGLTRGRLTNKGRICYSRNYLKMWGREDPTCLYRATVASSSSHFPIMQEKREERQVAQHQHRQRRGEGSPQSSSSYSRHTNIPGALGGQYKHFVTYFLQIWMNMSTLQHWWWCIQNVIQ